MCGIAGISFIDEPGHVSLDSIKKMIGAFIHRGPDESGIYLDRWTGLGHARLSIIDLSGGTQPIHNEDGTLWIIYNGEIFNYPELRQDLICRGHRFYTSTDTEVILHLYEESGPSCLDSLNGQFAFAIWNTERKELFLARDRVGILPLYYTILKNCIIFSSEIKSIFTLEEIDHRVDPIAMDQIFTFWTTLPGRTIFKGIHELPPGHYLKASQSKISIQKYWDIPFYPSDEQLTWPVEEICMRIKELFRDAIRIRLRADVPVGCYLSGGLDSSGVATLVKKYFNNQLKTFGILFEEKAFDESEYQKYVISYLKSDHTDILATNEQIKTSFPNVLWHCEKPLLRTAPVPLFLLSKAVCQNSFKVVLTGEGADEIFGGYNIFREAKIRRFWAKQPESKSRPLLLGKLYPYIFHNNPRAKHFIQSFFGKGLDKVDDPFFSHLIRWQNTSKTKTFFSKDLGEKIGDYYGYDDLKQYIPESYKTWDYLSKAQYLEMAVFLSNYILSSQGDRVAMANAVEVRPPFLDHRLIDFMGQVPSKWKINVLNEKYILKKAFQEILPEKITKRPKNPYRAPIRESLLHGNDPYIEEMLSDHFLNITKLFDVLKVRKLLNKLQRVNHASELDNMALAGILSSQIIYDKFINHFPSGSIYPVSPDLLIDRRSIKKASQNILFP
jgi:asparagine synthase (glutamine-hydrolysing)